MDDTSTATADTAVDPAAGRAADREADRAADRDAERDVDREADRARAVLLADAQSYCLAHALALAGPDALRLYGLAAPVRGTDLLLVSAGGPPLADLAAGLAETLRAAGHRVQEPPGSARRCQLTATTGEPPLDGAAVPAHLGVELRREPLHHLPTLPPGAPVPVAALDDTAALAVLTLCERALPADLRGLHALTAHRSEGELLALTSAFDSEADFTTRTLADRLESAAALLQPETDAAGTRQWAESWAQDLRLDLLETTELADGLHDPYLDRVESESEPGFEPGVEPGAGAGRGSDPADDL
ncbi:hypothetical protein GCM10009759_46540 [Kitasatospora saccharophila]|uniref:Nucleotidyltransferase AbiEii toxin of type IV toxin-antitoxin system n=1 Tax=Kitasatospora saccharophila TaxID=407973 RepID=A0ABN2X8Y1_9ACTN